MPPWTLGRRGAISKSMRQTCALNCPQPLLLMQQKSSSSTFKPSIEPQADNTTRVNHPAGSILLMPSWQNDGLVNQTCRRACPMVFAWKQRRIRPDPSALTFGPYFYALTNWMAPLMPPPPRRTGAQSHSHLFGIRRTRSTSWRVELSPCRTGTLSALLTGLDTAPTAPRAHWKHRSICTSGIHTRIEQLEIPHRLTSVRWAKSPTRHMMASPMSCSSTHPQEQCAAQEFWIGIQPYCGAHLTGAYVQVRPSPMRPREV